MSNKSESVEEKMIRLREMTAWFEGDEFTLDQATEMFEKASLLAREIEADLTKLKNKVTELKQSFEEV